MKILKTIGWIIFILLGVWAANENQKQNAKEAIYEVQQEQNRAKAAK